jgi:hypothetical protein
VGAVPGAGAKGAPAFQLPAGGTDPAWLGGYPPGWLGAYPPGWPLPAVGGTLPAEVGRNGSVGRLSSVMEWLLYS